ncbi:T9SS type A sorting domain-containing protein [Bizionia paragorgiae]|uniref:Por secretion system C-terminal sorting domain-containing protein n=1 Tax=Bizionia paragorgiae TaxID=283786 RepID=A0A1H4BDQ7_BIZPA|nr:T9SS type A sorting domain-containing protein [Bizionia paragorgiae]SEA46138.1 Por secretion system C-terminal sorting domain-containing protein [Bizionia paragorgiae]
MKKLYFLLLTFMATLSYGQDMIITGAFDGPLPGGAPKLIEIYVANDIADLSAYGFGSANNGDGTDGEELTFSGSATAGDFIYIFTEGSSPGSLMTYFGINGDYDHSSAGINGDDALELFHNGSVIDTFGDINVDGSGEPWDYLDGWAYRVDGTGPDGSTFVVGNWTYSGINATDNCTDNTTCSSVFPIGTYTPTASSTPSLAILTPGDGTELAPGTTSANLSIAVQNFTVGATTGGFDGHIHWTINGTDQAMKYDTNDEVITVANGQSYTVFMELVDNNHTPLVPAVQSTVTFSVASVTQVSDIAALRVGTVGDFYELTGEALISYIVTDNTRNQKYIQDGTAGILIDDTAGTLTGTFNIGDGITSLTGELAEYAGTLQLIPSVDVASSSTGNTVTPQVMDLATFLASPEDHESELISITDVTFPDADGTAVFADNTNYDIVKDANTGIMRVSFGDEDLIGTLIEATPAIVTGLGGDFNGTYQILSRYASDVDFTTLSVNNVTANATAFSLYPNPTTSGFVTIKTASTEAINVSVYNVLGKQVINTTLNNTSLNVSSLNAGVYIVNINQNGNTTTKKLVIK